jgi:ribose transport system substrate-binding protein
MKAKVPVLTFDSDSPKSHRLLFVGTNNYNAGYQAGLAVAKLLVGQNAGGHLAHSGSRLDQP